ncbi:MAG: type II toxin-antitoxin system RelE/ParE family toxin, partial [Thauera sp.]|nr:type II toxin-antitoxin system RelE/ParE family toxin [Thauera sp.]
YLDARVIGSADPRSAGKALSGPQGGLWRYPLGDYRVICSVEDGVMRVLVLQIGNRREVYR